ncbi:PREDICTED: uncharacterized protein LOC106805922 [Priapulus caudatus]|uniref:Uncharacterized protein LOC106805922 n=1 Tax=Priapulus caudatus TaxID=37621 RepID=A0ABM1DTB0_PRICU|nr:PREDICTED: uncharacterized protein LOC106805922 [Priapulus caudatus]
MATSMSFLTAYRLGKITQNLKLSGCRLGASIQCQLRAPTPLHKLFSTDGGQDQPIQYSTSLAKSWSVRQSFGPAGSVERNYKYEAFRLTVILGSVSAFLIYFCVLREENDIDDELDVPLIDRIKGLEETQLRQSFEYNSSKGLPTERIEQRLKEIELEKSYEQQQQDNKL